MLRAQHRHFPRPPGAGRKKVTTLRAVLKGWLYFLLGGGLLVAVLWPYGVGEGVRRMHRQFLAVSYLRAAVTASMAQPVRRDQALHDLGRAVALMPEDSGIGEQAAQMYFNLRAYEEALVWLRKQESPTLLSRVSMGQCLLMTGQVAEGEQLLDEALEEARVERNAGRMPEPMYALILNNVGYVYAEAGLRLSEARAAIERAVRAVPLQPAYLDSLGWALYRLGELQDAAFYLEQSVRLFKPAESAEMYYHLGVVYASLGRHGEARRALQRCLELDPTWTEASDQLQDLGHYLPQPALAMANNTNLERPSTP